MNDLISRGELLKAMNTWDKFEYDCHRGLVRIDSTNNEEYVPFVYYEDMVKCVNDMQTAYSINKIVKELEELKMRYFLTIANTGDEKSDFAYENVGNALDKAIEIVKQDVVSSDVCEWKIFDNSLTDEPQWVYETACGKYVGEEHTSKAFVYCPYCGKKIKVVE